MIRIRSLFLAASLVASNVAGLAAQDSTAAPVDPGPAPFVKPPPGTVLTYTGGVTQRVDSVNGMRVVFSDGRGQPGATVGLFVIDNPRNPRTVDTQKLEAFWPLRLGRETVVELTRGQERWQVALRVVGAEKVTVPAGTYLTYVIEGAQAPKLVKNPRTPTTVTTWWYSPELGAVVRFATTTNGGPLAAGAVRRHELLTIRGPRAPADR